MSDAEKLLARAAAKRPPAARPAPATKAPAQTPAHPNGATPKLDAVDYLEKKGFTVSRTPTGMFLVNGQKRTLADVVFMVNSQRRAAELAPLDADAVF